MHAYKIWRGINQHLDVEKKLVSGFFMVCINVNLLWGKETAKCWTGILWFLSMINV